MNDDLRTRLAGIRLLLLDVDGVMTDGGIVWDANGVESKTFNVKDGHGIKLLQRAGIQTGIITGRNSAVVTLRAKELGIEILHQGSLQKAESYSMIKQQTGMEDRQIAFMGDDLIDIPVLKQVGFSAAPADGVAEVLERVDYVAKSNGGRGAVRELCDLLLKANEKWDELVVKRYGL